MRSGLDRELGAVAQPADRHGHDEPHHRGATQEERLERAEVEREQPEQHEELREYDVVRRRKPMLKIAQRPFHECEADQHQSRDADGERQIDIAVVTGGHVHHPARRILGTEAHGLGIPECFESVAPPGVCAERFDGKGPDLGAAGERDVDREHADDCACGVAGDRADGEKADERQWPERDERLEPDRARTIDEIGDDGHDEHHARGALAVRLD